MSIGKSKKKTIENPDNVHSDLTTKMLLLNDADLIAFETALRFFCPKGSDCIECPCYTGYDSRFPLVLCVAIQAHHECIRRGLFEAFEGEEIEQ